MTPQALFTSVALGFKHEASVEGELTLEEVHKEQNDLWAPEPDTKQFHVSCSGTCCNRRDVLDCKHCKPHFAAWPPERMAGPILTFTLTISVITLHLTSPKAAFVDFCAESFAGSLDMIQQLGSWRQHKWTLLC